MKKMQKMNVTKIITLTRELNTMNTLSARKNIVEIKRFKKLMIFRIIFEKNKKILKLNDFWIKNVAITTILKRERFKMMIHEIKVKSMSQNIKNENAKIIEKIDEIMHSKLQIKSVKWLIKDYKKKKYVLMMMWMRGAEIANKLIQLKIIMKSDIKTVKYYKKNCKIKQCIKCQNYNHWIYFCKNKQCCAHYAQKHHFIKYFHQKNASKWRCDFYKEFYKTFNHQCLRK